MVLTGVVDVPVRDTRNHLPGTQRKSQEFWLELGAQPWSGICSAGLYCANTTHRLDAWFPFGVWCFSWGEERVPESGKVCGLDEVSALLASALQL